MVDDPRTRLEKIVIISLAGRIAERRAALEGQSSGMRLAIHEAAHAAVAHELADTVYEVSVVEERSVPVGRSHLGGYCRHGVASEDPGADRQRWRDDGLETDRRNAVKLCWLLAPGDPGWKSDLRYIRTLREKARNLVNAYWSKIIALAGALEMRRKLSQDEIADVLAHNGL